MSGLVHTTLGGPVAVVRLADAAGRNVLTPELSAEFCGGLDRAVARPESRVVLLCGLPDVFCAGASRGDLLGGPGSVPTTAYEGLVRAPLQCPLPVVSAMRGHAIGGGLLLGLYADVPVLSERSVYTANFLGYGFSPCMGATWLLPHRLGPALGAEMLLGAGRLRGRELRERSVPLRVLAHDEVEPAAQALAAQIATASRLTLEHTKAALAADWRISSEQAFQREIPGHVETLRLPEVQLRAAQYGPSPLAAGPAANAAAASERG
jgi:polyketide biosynthesis enoyl-CoA hydratase PksI